MEPYILITGGAGYIGSHTVLSLIEARKQVVVLDNLSNASVDSLVKIEQLTGASIPFVEGDISDPNCLSRIFKEYRIESVVHFAGLKAVGESVEQPLRYYQNNVAGTLTLCQEMAKAGVFELVFSSSATVYGDPASVPILENFPTGATTNPYGTSKHMVERVLFDLATADPRWKIAILRYFNPIGAHESGMIGEDPNGIPNNLVPYISQVAVGKLEKLSVFGDDYDTADGTGVRDYIHVVDLANGHLKALEMLNSSVEGGAKAYNLGTGTGYSVLEMISAFEKASGKSIPYEIAPRRAGDIAQCYAEPSLARRELGWEAQRTIDQMMQDTWRWQSKNPDGYKS